jgi:hypothetical protein
MQTDGDVNGANWPKIRRMARKKKVVKISVAEFERYICKKGPYHTGAVLFSELLFV